MEQMNMLEGMFGKVAPGMCRLSINGDIAVKTSSGYKSYSTKTGRLTNCSSFVLDVGDDMFFVVPSKKVSAGDIILVGGKPKCVIRQEGDIYTVISYEDSAIENIIPERHMLLGDAYFFGKVVSVFGRVNAGGKKGMGRIMKYMLLSEMMKGRSGPQTISPMLAMAMSGGGMGDMFEGIFDTDEEGEDE